VKTILLISIASIFFSCNDNNEKIKTLQEENQNLKKYIKESKDGSYDYSIKEKETKKIDSIQKDMNQLNKKNDSLIKSLEKQLKEFKEEKNKKTETSNNTNNKAKYTKEEFREIIKGKTKAELLNILGRPNSTQDYETTEHWFYDKIVYDPITRTNRDVNLVIKYGIVTNIAIY